MIKINLVAETPTAAVKKRRRPEFSLGARQGDLLLMIVLGISLVTLGSWYLVLKGRVEDRRQTERQKRAERDELKPFIDKVEELEAKREALKHKITVINNLKQQQRGPVRIMDEVSRALPELVWLTNMNLRGTALSLNGMAMDENAIANYIANLNASPFFQEPKLRDISRSKGDSFTFKLECVFTYAPPEISASDT